MPSSWDTGRRLIAQSLDRLRDLPSLLQDIKSGRSPLIHAVENNSLSMVQLLLQVGTAPALGLSSTLSSSTSPVHSPFPGTDTAFQLWLPLWLRFQICPFLLGLVMSALYFNPQAALLSRAFSLSSLVPKMSRPREEAALLSLPAGFGPFRVLSFRTASGPFLSLTPPLLRRAGTAG